MLDRLRSWFAAPAVARLENELRLAQNRAATTTTNRNGKVASGVEINAGTFGYEPTKALTGSERWVTLQKMQTDAHVSGALRANRLPLLNGSWEFKPAGDNPKDQEIADFCNAVLLRRQTEQYGREYWSRTAWEAQRLPEILEMLTSGFSLFVKTWRVVNMKKVVDLSFVEPDSVDPRGWDLDGSDNIVRIKRSFTDPTGKYRMNEPIDARDVALYVWDLRGARFEGTPFVRAMYGPWFRKDFFLRQALIWAQKVGAPAPLGAYPQGWAPEEVNRFAAFIQQLRGTAPAEAYGVFPKGSDGSPADVTFAGSAVGEVDRVGSLIGNENAEIAHAGGTKSQLLGETSSGARAVGDVISETEYTQIEAIARIVCTWENHGIGNLPGVVEDLVTRNFAGVTAMPELTVSGVRPDESTRDLPRLFEAVTAGLVPRHPEIQRQVVERLGFVLPDDAYEMVEDERRTVDTWSEDEAEDDAADEPEQDEEEFSACCGHGRLEELDFATEPDWSKVDPNADYQTRLRQSRAVKEEARVQDYYSRNHQRTRYTYQHGPGDAPSQADGVYRRHTRINACCGNPKCKSRYTSLVTLEPDENGEPRIKDVSTPLPNHRYRVYLRELRNRTHPDGTVVDDGTPYVEFVVEAENEMGTTRVRNRRGDPWSGSRERGECPDCHKNTFDLVYPQQGGDSDQTVSCTSRCWNAAGGECVCSCGGTQHGSEITRLSKLFLPPNKTPLGMVSPPRANLPEPGDPEGTPASPLPESKEREPGPRSVAGYKARAKKRSAKRTSRIGTWTPRSWDDVPESDLSAQLATRYRVPRPPDDVETVRPPYKKIHVRDGQFRDGTFVVNRSTPGVYRERTRVNATCSNCGAKWTSLVSLGRDKTTGLPRIRNIENRIPGVRYAVVSRRDKDIGKGVERFDVVPNPRHQNQYPYQWDGRNIENSSCMFCNEDTVRPFMVDGVEDPNVRCTSSCTNSDGPTCECSCGGERHGMEIGPENSWPDPDDPRSIEGWGTIPRIGWSVSDTGPAWEDGVDLAGRGPLLEPIGPPVGKRRAKTRLEASFVDLAAVQDSFRVGEADCLAALRQVFRLAQVELKGRVHAGKISRRSIDTQRRSSFRSYGRAMTELLPVLVACGETGAEHVAQEIERQAAAGTALAAVDPPGMPNRVRVAGRTVLKEAAVAFAEEVRTYATLTIGNLWDRMLVEVLNEYVRLTSQGLEGDALVAEMDRFIDSLSENTLTDPARKSSTVAYNQGRDMALQTAKAVGASTFSVRTAVLDEALCEPCLELDGEVVTIGTPEYKAIMPPAKCLGKDRCRCFMVGVAERFSTDLVRPIENWTPEMIEERFPHIRVIR